MSFENLGLHQSLLQALAEIEYTNPTPIQQKSIPHLLSGTDLLACAQTGTGKTAAFALPILQKLHTSDKNRDRKVKALILTPTRELAIQIHESITDYSKYIQVRHTVIFGGVPQGKQISRLQQNPELLIATPGRLLDLISQGHIQLNHLQFFVLDEADRMLDMGFIHDIKKIIKLLPAQRQSLFFSATMPTEIKQLASNILRDPIQIEVTPVSSAAVTVHQQVVFVEQPDKCSVLLNLLNHHISENALIFTRTKHGADRVAKFLRRNKLEAEVIHGNKSQQQRQAALSRFKSNQTRIMVATDIAARGIDIEQLSYVINFDIPNISETYVHRIGRTGRAGRLGNALSLCNSEEWKHVESIQSLIRKKLEILNTSDIQRKATVKRPQMENKQLVSAI